MPTKNATPDFLEAAKRLFPILNNDDAEAAMDAMEGADQSEVDFIQTKLGMLQLEAQATLISELQALGARVGDVNTSLRALLGVAKDTDSDIQGIAQFISELKAKVAEELEPSQPPTTDPTAPGASDDAPAEVQAEAGTKEEVEDAAEVPSPGALEQPEEDTQSPAPSSPEDVPIEGKDVTEGDEETSVEGDPQ